MESRWWRVKALPSGNEKPLMVLSRQWQGQICDVWMGTRLEAETRERRLLDGWVSDCVVLNWAVGGEGGECGALRNTQEAGPEFQLCHVLLTLSACIN